MKQIVIFTGKGGVGKSTAASWYSLDQSIRGQKVHLLSVDPMHSLADAFNIRSTSDSNPIGDNEWINLWKNKQWKKVKKQIKKEVDVGKLYLKRVVPTGRGLRGIKNAVINNFYTEYELRTGTEIEDGHELLVIDTDSLGGFHRLLNYVNEVPGLGDIIRERANVVPVSTLETASLNKTNDALSLLSTWDHHPKLTDLIINHVRKDDTRTKVLMKKPLLMRLHKTVLYEQPQEPLGNLLLNLQVPQEIKDEQFELDFSSVTVPEHNVYFVCGKGGQGKSTVACSLAVRLAEKGKKVYLISADARSSLSDILDERVGFIDEGRALKLLSKTSQYSGLQIGVLKENPYFDQVPGTPMMKALMKLAMIEPSDCLIIDAPPSGNVVKSFKQGLPYENPIDWFFFKLEMMYLRLTGKKKEKEYFDDRRKAYVNGLKIMQTPRVLTLPVLQPTKTALTETECLEGELVNRELYPFNIYDDYEKHIVLNRVNSRNANFANKIREVDYPADYEDCPGYGMSVIPEMLEEPRGRKALSSVGQLLLG